MTCSRCQTINPQGAVACAACGAPLVAMPMQQGYAPPGQPYMVPMPMMAQRSGVPKTMGVLMIVFSSLGLLFGLAGLAGDTGDENTRAFLAHIDEFKTFETLTKVFGVIGLGISGLHLYAGIRSVGYRRNAPTLAATYAIANIVTTIINLVIVYAWLKPAIDAVPGAGAVFGAAMLVGGVIGVTWPIIVLALMTRPAAKAACVN